MELTMISENKEYSRQKFIESLDDISGPILDFCDTFKLKTCKFTISGTADIETKIGIRSEGLSALFG